MAPAVLPDRLLQLLWVLGRVHTSLLGKGHWLFPQVTHVIKVGGSERHMQVPLYPHRLQFALMLTSQVLLCPCSAPCHIHLSFLSDGQAGFRLRIKTGQKYKSLHTLLSEIGNGIILLINLLFYITYSDSVSVTESWLIYLVQIFGLFSVNVLSYKTKFPTLHCSKTSQWYVSRYHWMRLLGNWGRVFFLLLDLPPFPFWNSDIRSELQQLCCNLEEGRHTPRQWSRRKWPGSLVSSYSLYHSPGQPTLDFFIWRKKSTI